MIGLSAGISGQLPFGGLGRQLKCRRASMQPCVAQHGPRLVPSADWLAITLADVTGARPLFRFSTPFRVLDWGSCWPAFPHGRRASRLQARHGNSTRQQQSVSKDRATNPAPYGHQDDSVITSTAIWKRNGMRSKRCQSVQTCQLVQTQRG